MRRVVGFFLAVFPLMAQTPSFPPNGVVEGAGFSAAVSAGAIVSIFGTNLSSNTAFASTVPLSVTLNQTSVTFNGTAVPLFFVSAGQVNLQIPFDVSGSATVVVTSAGQSSAPQTVPIAAVSPGIFNIGGGRGAILLANTATLAQPVGSVPGRDTQPVTRGNFISIFATGLGPVQNPPPAGTIGNAQQTVNRVQVNIGAISLFADFAGLAPGFVGLYQVNVQVPSSVQTGSAVPVQLVVGGATSNTVTIAVQ